MLLGGHARVRAGDVDERDHREPVPVGELHRAHRLPVPLRIGHAEVAPRALLDVAALLIADQRDRAAAEAPEADDDRRVVAVLPVAVELEPVVEQALHVVERVRPVRMARELDGTPDLLVARLRDDAVELALQPLELARDARAPQERKAPQPAQLLPQSQLGVTRHRRRAAAAGRQYARSSGRGTIASTWP